MTEPHIKNILILKQARTEDRFARVNGIPTTGMTCCAMSRKDLLPHRVRFGAIDDPARICQLTAEISQHCYGAKTKEIDRQEFYGSGSVPVPQKDGQA